MNNNWHPKIKELALRAMPIEYSTVKVDKNGTLTDDDKLVKGYLTVWGVKDDYGTIFVKGCFAKSINERGPNSNSKYKIKFLYCHRQDDPIGQFTVLQEDDYGLYFEAMLDDFDAVPSAKRSAAQLKSGTLNNFSHGFTYVWDKLEYDEKLDAVIVLEANLFEGSVVGIPSNMETTQVRSAADWEAQKILLNEETEELIRTLPREVRLQIRQLLTRHVTLANSKPLAQPQKALEQSEPENVGKFSITQILKTF